MAEAYYGPVAQQVRAKVKKHLTADLWSIRNNSAANILTLSKLSLDPQLLAFYEFIKVVQYSKQPVNLSSYNL